MPRASRKWYWFGIGAVLLAGIGVAIGTAAEHRDAPNFADTVIRICAAPLRGASVEEAPFFPENSAAMSRMMIGIAIALDRKEPSGDFVAMMSAHHQGPIDMAEALLRYDRNERLRRLAPEIIAPSSRRCGDAISRGRKPAATGARSNWKNFDIWKVPDTQSDHSRALPRDPGRRMPFPAMRARQDKDAGLRVLA